MIIQINATVCAAVDHGDDRQHRIAGSDQRRRRRKVGKRASDQEKGEIKGMRLRCRFFAVMTVGRCRDYYQRWHRRLEANVTRRSWRCRTTPLPIHGPCCARLDGRRDNPVFGSSNDA